MDRSKGIAFALAACFIWGLVFIVPQYMTDFSSIEIAFGRYFFYGTLSLAIFFNVWLWGDCRYPLAVWIKVIRLGLAISFGYFICIVLAIRLASPVICALVMGISPVSIAFYGNWKKKECSYGSLMLPSAGILIGLLVINIPHLTASTAPVEFTLGFLCSLAALSAWSWYVVANSEFLKTHPEVKGSDWCTMLGVAALFWAAIFGLSLGFLSPERFEFEKFTTWDDSLIAFLIGSAVLGLLCSWLGNFLWNRASANLPVSLAGHLTIFETIFGLLFVYTIEQRLPPLTEFFGIVILLSAVTYGIRRSGQAALQHA